MILHWFHERHRWFDDERTDVCTLLRCASILRRLFLPLFVQNIDSNDLRIANFLSPTLVVVVNSFPTVAWKMSAPSIRRRTSEISATSSESSEPSVQQRTSRQRSKVSGVVNSDNSSSTRVRRRLNNKTRTVKWLDSSRNPRKKMPVGKVVTETQQQQDDKEDTDDPSMHIEQCDNEFAPSAIISSVNVSPSETNRKIDRESTSDGGSPIVSDEDDDDDVHDRHLTSTGSMPKRAKKPEDGAYTCKLCSKVWYALSSLKCAMTSELFDCSMKVLHVYIVCHDWNVRWFVVKQNCVHLMSSTSKSMVWTAHYSKRHIQHRIKQTHIMSLTFRNWGIAVASNRRLMKDDMNRHPLPLLLSAEYTWYYFNHISMSHNRFGCAYLYVHYPLSYDCDDVPLTQSVFSRSARVEKCIG